MLPLFRVTLGLIAKFNFRTRISVKTHMKEPPFCGLWLKVSYKIHMNK